MQDNLGRTDFDPVQSFSTKIKLRLLIGAETETQLCIKKMRQINLIKLRVSLCRSTSLLAKDNKIVINQTIT